MRTLTQKLIKELTDKGFVAIETLRVNNTLKVVKKYKSFEKALEKKFLAHEVRRLSEFVNIQPSGYLDYRILQKEYLPSEYLLDCKDAFLPFAKQVLQNDQIVAGIFKSEGVTLENIEEQHGAMLFDIILLSKHLANRRKKSLTYWEKTL